MSSFLKTLSLPEDRPSEDILLDLLCSGLRAQTPEQRKSLQNSVGKLVELFVAESLGMEYRDTEGADVVCRKRKVIAEVKNRYNTMNHGSQQRIKRVMKDLTLGDEFRGFEKYIVILHPAVPGYVSKLGNGVTKISAARFFKKYGVNFRERYLDLLSMVGDFYNVPVPEITPYYENVVFAERKKRKG